MSEDVNRIGLEAKNFLLSDAFRIAMDELERRPMESWASGILKTEDERRDAYYQVRAARMFRERLTALFENMKLHQAQVERREKLSRSTG
jgi:hypothetical protein